MNTFVRVAVIALLTLPATGCLFGGSSDVRQEGNYVAPETVSQIQIGKTKAEWVQAVLGEPTQKIKVDADSEIWRYAYTETKTGSGYVFLIFKGSDNKVTKTSVFVEFKGDTVSRTWRG